MKNHSLDVTASQRKLQSRDRAYLLQEAADGPFLLSSLLQGRWNVEAQTLVKAFKQQCVDEGQLDVALLKSTVELIGLTAVSNKFLLLFQFLMSGCLLTF